MTTTHDYSSTPQPSFPAPPTPQAPAKRGMAAIIIGAVLAGSGFLTAVSGGVLLAMFGNGQAITSGAHTFSTSTSAVVSDIGHIDNLRGWERLTGEPTLHISAQNVADNGVFVGVGPTDDVERYLDNVATERVADLELAPFALHTRTSDGTAIAQVPGAESFWVASAESVTEAQISWALEEGDYEIVVMNADGSAGIITAAEIGASLPSSTGLWILVTAIGVLMMLGGSAAIVVGSRQGRNGS